MGDRASREALPNSEEKVNSFIYKNNELDQNLKVFDNNDFLKETAEIEVGIYQPKSIETKAIFSKFIGLLSTKYLQNQPNVVLHGAADEILHILHDSELTVRERTRQIKSLLGVSEFGVGAFSEVKDIAELLTDFSSTEIETTREFNDKLGGFAGGQDNDLELGIDAMDESDEESDADILEEKEEKLEDNVMHEDELMEERTQNKSNEEKLDSARDYFEKESSGLNIGSINLTWLQNRLHSYLPNESNIVGLAQKIFDCLLLAESDVEKQLIQNLGLKSLDFIKIILENRPRIFFGLKLSQADSNSKVDAILATMKAEGLAHLVEEYRKNEHYQINHKSRSQRSTKSHQPVDEHPLLERALNLKDYVMKRGEKQMSQTKILLPKNSWQTRTKTYEEIHVPPYRAENAEKEKLVLVKDMPKFCHNAFKNMHSLNRIQSKIYPEAMASALYKKHAPNLLVCAPTGAGKTNVAMMTILNEISTFVSEQGSKVDVSRLKTDLKICYIAPMKALVQEIVQNYSKRLQDYGIVVKELSGDVNLTKSEIDNTQLIVATPEKFDVITRKNNVKNLLDKIDLIIFDEVHLLHNERGAVIETLMCRIFLYEEQKNLNIRIVGLSATLPNYQDAADFMRVSSNGLFFFDSSYRPCPLHQTYIGLLEKKAIKRLNNMDEICFKLLKDKLTDDTNKSHQILVFVHSRNDTYKTGKMLVEKATEAGLLGMFVDSGDIVRKEILKSEGEKVGRNQNLKEVLEYGIGIHHAGLSRDDRNLVEDLFLNKNIKVLISTATLAWGVNLPANTVIIKGTMVYNMKAGGYTELSFIDILQMLGRAGRPQFDSFGTGIIITDHANLSFYLSLLNQQLPIESQLVKELPNVLNAEIVNGNIIDFETAVTWLKLTYLNIRMEKNPRLYGVENVEDLNASQVSEAVDRLQRNFIHSAFITLSKAGLIRYNISSAQISFTELGRIASYFYLSYESVNNFSRFIRPSISDIDVLKMFTLSEEFDNIIIRNAEKIELEQLQDVVPIPIRDPVEEKAFKINCLLQCFISGHKLTNFSIKCDMIYIYMSAERIFRALFELALHYGYANVAYKCLDFANMVSNKVWSVQLFLRQIFTEYLKYVGKAGKVESITIPKEFSGISSTTLQKLERNNLSTKDFYNLSEFELAELAKQDVKVGQSLYRLIRSYPKLIVNVEVQPISSSALSLDISIYPNFEFIDAFYGFSQVFWIFIEGNDGNLLLHKQQFVITKQMCSILSRSQHEKEKLTIDDLFELRSNVVVEINPEVPPKTLFVKVKSDKYLHSVTCEPVNLRRLVIPKKFSPLTTLHDLSPVQLDQSLNVTSLTWIKKCLHAEEQMKVEDFERIFESHIKQEFESLLSILVRNSFPSDKILSSNNVDLTSSLLTGDNQKHLNCIQVQVLQSILNSENLICACDSGAGANFLSELSILALVRKKLLRLCFYAFLGQQSGNTSLNLEEALSMKVLYKLSEKLTVLYVVEDKIDSCFLVERLQATVCTGLHLTIENLLLYDICDSFNNFKESKKNIYVLSYTQMLYITLHSDQQELAKKISSIILLDLSAVTRKEDGFILESLLSRCRLLQLLRRKLVAEHIGSGVALTTALFTKGTKVKIEEIFHLIDAQSTTRIFAFSQPLANVREIGQLLECNKDDMYGFPHSVSPKPKKVFLQPFNDYSYRNLMESMSAHLLPSLLKHTEIFIRKTNERVLIFVSSYGQAKMRALDLVGDLKSKNLAEKIILPITVLSEAVKNIRTLLIGKYLRLGIGILHPAMPSSDVAIINSLYSNGFLKILFVVKDVCYFVNHVADLVIICGTSEGHLGEDNRREENRYSNRDLMKMISLAYKGESPKTVVMTHLKDVQFYSKFIQAPIVNESILLPNLSQIFLYEIAVQNIKSKQNCLDYFAWTFTFRRLLKNPNFYGLQSTNQDQVTEFLSEIVEEKIEELQDMKMIEAGNDLCPLSYGLIALKTFVNINTIEFFNSCVQETSKYKSLIEILSSSLEFESFVQVNASEYDVLKTLLYDSTCCKLGVSLVDFSSPRLKVNILIQAYLSRYPLSDKLRFTQTRIVKKCILILRALIGVCEQKKLLKPILYCIEFCQMIVQATWKTDSELLQIPHVTKEVVAKLQQHDVHTVFDLLDMEDDLRIQCLDTSQEELSDIATFCNSFPDIEVNSEITKANGKVSLNLDIRRVDEIDNDAELGTVYSTFYPLKKLEKYYIVVCDSESSKLCAFAEIISLCQSHELSVDLGETSKISEFQVYVMCDSYRGSDVVKAVT